MIKINWSDYFVRRVVFGFWTLRRTNLTSNLNIGKYEHEVRWKWRWDGFESLTIPWHRCWNWEDRDRHAILKRKR